MKSAVKQFIPPILLPPAKALLKAVKGRPVDTSSPEISGLKTAFQKRNAGLNKGQIALRDGLVLGLHPDSMRSFEYFCYRSLEMVEEMDSFISLTKGKTRLLDIGALHGVFSLAFAAASPAAQSVAVDASPIAFARLLYNAHKNESCDVVPIECALSDKAGVLEMHYEWEHAVAAGTGSSASTSHGRLLSVPKRTGDELCDELQFAPDVIKIDVEGHEVSVIRGLKQTLQATKPMVFLELHPTRITEDTGSIEELLKVFFDLNYTIVNTSGKTITVKNVMDFDQDTRVVFIAS